MRIWATSDWHLNHRKIGEYEPIRDTLGAPFAEILVERYLEVVRDEDRVWFLGDIGFGSSALETIGALPGQKFLVRGNHDKCHSDTRLYLKARFIAVTELFAWHKRRNGQSVLLSHYPALRAARDARYKPERLRLEALRKSQSAINFHGHTHSWEHPDKGRFVNTCPEVNDFRPILLETLPS